MMMVILLGLILYVLVYLMRWRPRLLRSRPAPGRRRAGRGDEGKPRKAKCLELASSTAKIGSSVAN